jgi:hypothetical protein
MRWVFLLVLFAAPLAMGAYRPPAYIPLLISAYVVDFNLRIPANAVTFAALAGLAVQPPRLQRDVSAATPSPEPRQAAAVSVEGLSVRPPKAARGIAS